MSFAYTFSCTTDHTKCGSSDTSDFPMLINETRTAFKTTANGGNVTSSNGYDICFFSDSARTTKYSWEVEYYNGTTGQIIAWVRVPLSHTTDLPVYGGAGDSSITTFQGGSTGTAWDSNYYCVYHLPDGSVLGVNDSTSNGRNGTKNAASGSGPFATSGQIDGGAVFNATNGESVQLPQISLSGTAGSVYAWFKTTATGVIVGDGNNPTNTGCSQYNPFLYIGTDSKLRGGVYNGSGIPVDMLSSGSATVVDGNWHQAVYTTDGTTQWLYLDGVQVASTSGLFDSGTQYFGIGVGYTNAWADTNFGNFFFTGSIDEVRLSNVARSADYILSSYNNQHSPSTFYTFASGSSGTTITRVASFSLERVGTSSTAVGLATERVAISSRAAAVPAERLATVNGPAALRIETVGAAQRLLLTTLERLALIQQSGQMAAERVQAVQRGSALFVERLAAASRAAAVPSERLGVVTGSALVPIEILGTGQTAISALAKTFVEWGAALSASKQVPVEATAAQRSPSMATPHERLAALTAAAGARLETLGTVQAFARPSMERIAAAGGRAVTPLEILGTGVSAVSANAKVQFEILGATAASKSLPQEQTGAVSAKVALNEETLGSVAAKAVAYSEHLMQVAGAAQVSIEHLTFVVGKSVIAIAWSQDGAAIVLSIDPTGVIFGRDRKTAIVGRDRKDTIFGD